MKRHGVPEVWAADFHPAAVACARKNVLANPDVGPITVVHSDLFQDLPRVVEFDLVVFNQPFGPGEGEPVCGCGTDGGYEITRRFLVEAPRHVTRGATLLMAFSDREAPEHSPDRVARELGYAVDTLLHAFYGNANNYIFEIKPIVSEVD